MKIKRRTARKYAKKKSYKRNFKIFLIVFLVLIVLTISSIFIWLKKPSVKLAEVGICDHDNICEKDETKASCPNDCTFIIPTNENVLCIYNQNNQTSREVCGYYLLKRPGANSLGLNIPDDIFLNPYGGLIERDLREISSLENFTKYIVSPVLEFVDSHNELSITHLAVAPDIPIRLWNGGGIFSSRNVLASPNYSFVYWSYNKRVGNVNYPNYPSYIEGANRWAYFNPKNFYDQSNQDYYQRFVVSYLIGYSLDDIKKMIDKSVGSAPNLSEVVWIGDGATIERKPRRVDIDAMRDMLWLYAGIPSSQIISDTTDIYPFVINRPVVALGSCGSHCPYYNYWWGSCDERRRVNLECGGGWIAETPMVIFNATNRSIMLSYESFNAETFTGGIEHYEVPGSFQGKLADAISPTAFGGTDYSGSIAGAVGHSEEPWSDVVEIFNFFTAYAQGHTMAESAAIATLRRDIYIPMGDPLMRIVDNVSLYGMPCAENSDCASGYCSPDEKGMKRCHKIAGNCISFFPTKKALEYRNNSYLWIWPNYLTETQNGNSACFIYDKKNIGYCDNEEWQITACPKESVCTRIDDTAFCKSIQGNPCAQDSDCSSGNCDLDLDGIKRCHRTSTSCIIGDSGEETGSNNFACISNNEKKQCLNSAWSGQVIQCENECSKGNCLEEISPSPNTLLLRAGNSYSLALPISDKMKLSEIFTFPNDGLDGLQVLRLHNGGYATSTYDELIGIFSPDAEVFPGEGIYISGISQDLTLSFQNPVTEPKQINITAPSSLIGFPYCGFLYNASNVISELNSIGGNCSFITNLNTLDRSGPSYYWTGDMDYSREETTRKDFKLNNLEAYHIYCNENILWTPSCHPENYNKKKYFYEFFDVEQIGDIHTLSYKGDRILSFQKSGEPYYLKNISVYNNDENDILSYLIINNLTLGNNEKKTIYLKRKDQNSNGVCINDNEDLANKEQIINSCINIPCPGEKTGYSCEFDAENNEFIVSGLSHSGIIETTIDTIPPIITINSPTGDLSVSQVVFNISTNENADTGLMSLDGGLTNITMQKNGDTNFDYTIYNLEDGTYTSTFYVNDTIGNLNKASFIFTIDTIPPIITINSPTGNLSVSQVTFNITTNENADMGLVSLDGGLTNITMQKNGNANFNYTLYGMQDDTYTSTFYVNDTIGNLNKASFIFTIDTIPPIITINSQLENLSSLEAINWIYVNVSVIELNEDSITFVLSNVSGIFNVSIFNDKRREINWTNLEYGNYSFKIYVNDTLGNEDSTQTIEIKGSRTIETENPPEPPPPQDNGGGGNGGGGGGGGGIITPPCVPNWNCTISACVSGQQLKTCVDLRCNSNQTLNISKCGLININDTYKNITNITIPPDENITTTNKSKIAELFNKSIMKIKTLNSSFIKKFAIYSVVLVLLITAFILIRKNMLKRKAIKELAKMSAET